MPGVTSRDLATALGIAQSTVSRAFTPGASISAPLRARIHATAEAIGYRPNRLARGLVAGRSHLVGLVITPQTNLLHPELICELGRQLGERDRQLLLLPAADEAAAADAVERLRSYRVDTVIATGVLGEEATRAIIADGVPVITFNRLMAGVAGVSCDFAGGGAMLGARLSARGHERFGFVGGPPGSWVSDRILAGLRAALPPRATLRVANVAFDAAEAARALEQLEADDASLPTALIFANDTVAAGCLDQLRRHRGLKIPGDVAVVTFLTRASGQLAEYPLTGLVQPLSDMAQAIVQFATEPDYPDAYPLHRLLEPHFVGGATAAV